MERRARKRKAYVTEEFRFFDDLHKCVRQVLHEAHYEYNSLEAMNHQHSHYGNGTPIEELAAAYKANDEYLFQQRMKSKLK